MALILHGGLACFVSFTLVLYHSRSAKLPSRAEPARRLRQKHAVGNAERRPFVGSSARDVNKVFAIGYIDLVS